MTQSYCFGKEDYEVVCTMSCLTWYISLLECIAGKMYYCIASHETPEEPEQTTIEQGQTRIRSNGIKADWQKI